MQRRLAAILAADVVGYSRLMGEDEARVLAALGELRDTLFEPVVTARGGTIVKRMGDGWLVEFANVSDAIAGAIEVQSGLAVHEVIRLRIGVHAGELTSVDGDVFGDGVNVAARLEAMAEPGQVLISDTAFNSLDGTTARQFGGGEDRRLKNIARSVQVWRWPPTQASGSEDLVEAPQNSKPSIAVLPFDNMSGDAEQEFFSDGITEDVITDLSKVSGLTVIARNSTFAYKNKATDVRRICRELNVRYLLEGSVRRAGQRVRINAQLIEGATGAHVWADRFDGDLEDIFAVQDDITRQIVDALRVALTSGERDARQGRAKVNPEAYECLIRARQLMYRFDPASATAARADLERAVELDPGLSGTALACLSAIRSTEYFNAWNDVGPEGLQESLVLARKAIDADPRAAYAWHALAIALTRENEFEQAAQAAERAIALDPNFAGATTVLGAVRDIQGRSEEALALFDRSLRLDPKYHVALQFKGRALLGLGRLEEAETCLRDRLAEAPNSDMTRVYLAAICGLTGRAEEARAFWEDIPRVSPDFSFAHFADMVPDKTAGWFVRLQQGLRDADLLK